MDREIIPMNKLRLSFGYRPYNQLRSTSSVLKYHVQGVCLYLKLPGSTSFLHLACHVACTLEESPHLLACPPSGNGYVERSRCDCMSSASMDLFCSTPPIDAVGAVARRP